MIKLSRDIGIDLGTANVLVYLDGKGIVVNEPSAVALDKNTGKVLEVGAAAKKMLGRTPGNIVAARPLERGAISDYDMTATMLSVYLRRITKMSLVKPRVVVSVPSGITEVEERAVIQAAMEAGARRVYLMEEPLAAAIGAGMNIKGAGGSMVIDIGGGTTDIAVLSLNNVVRSTSIDAAGDAFDSAIIQYIRERYQVLVGNQTAEEIKMAIGCVNPRPEALVMTVKGRNLSSGLPQEVDVTSVDVMHALTTPCRDILYAVRTILEKTDPGAGGGYFEKRHYPHRRRQSALWLRPAHLPLHRHCLPCGRRRDFVRGPGLRQGAQMDRRDAGGHRQLRPA